MGQDSNDDLSLLNRLPPLPQVTALTRLASNLWQRGEVVALWLGGSFGRGEADRYSDLDVRVAVAPEALPGWKQPDLPILPGECVGRQLLSFGGETVLHHLLLAGGEVLDVWVQSTDQTPLNEQILVLGCRDPEFGRRLQQVRPEPSATDVPADPAAIRQLLVEYWILTHKQRKVLDRGLDLMVLTGLQFERAMLARLWYVLATGRDTGSQRPTIHSQTHSTRVLQQTLGPSALQLAGQGATSRAEILRVIEATRAEVSRVGRLLAERLEFEYPEALEVTVRRGWQEFIAFAAVPDDRGADS
jgi:hypothetical protein